MKITRVEAIPLWASFAEALGGEDKVPHEISHPAFGMRTIPLTGQGGVIVRIYTDAGLVGIGESMGRPGGPGIAALISEILEPMLIGQDPLRVEAHWSAMLEQLRFAPMAISGVDIALWDLRGQFYGEPINRLLGGPMYDAIDCYASPVPYLPLPEQSAERAQQFVTDGFRAIKLKIGRGVDLDLEHVMAVRDAIGPSIKLLVDCNGAYGVAESIRLAKGLVRRDVFWLEEPLHPEYAVELGEVRRRVDLPIASGEWLATVYQFRDLLDTGGADILMPNIVRCGGITGYRRIAEMAELRRVTIAPHGVGLGVGIVAALQGMAATHNLLIYENNQLFNPLRHTVLREPLIFRDSQLLVPTGPGLGAVLNEEIIDRFRLDRLSTGLSEDSQR